MRGRKKERLKMECVNWCEISTAIAAVLGVIGGLWSARRAYCQRQEDKEIKRSEFLNDLLGRFGMLDAQELFNAADSEDAGAKWFADALTDIQKRSKVDAVLSFFAMLCYMGEMNVISDKEFSFFSDQLTMLLGNNNVKRYLLDDDGVVRAPFENLVSYAVKVGLRDYPLLEKSASNTIMTAQNDCADMSRDDKIVIIKISRLYHDGMGHKEVYEATRGHWKANFDQISQYKTVLSVANGIIRGVYSVDQWYKGGQSDGERTPEVGRVMFSGKDVTDTQLAGWVGRSIKSLFPKGAANPVRYSTRCEIISALA